MSFWNHRIFRHADNTSKYKIESYALHEAFYDDNGKVDTWTEEPTTPYGETVDELIGHLEQMLADAKKFKEDILDYNKI